MHAKKIMLAAGLAVAVAACSANGSNHTLPALGGSQDAVGIDVRHAASVSILKMLTTKEVIGSTIDPKNGDQNPYGLAIGAYTGKKITKGDIYVCNFNNKANVQGTGTTIVQLAPKPGSKPVHWLQSRDLLGCAGTAVDFADNMWASNYGAKNVLRMTNNATIDKVYKGANYVHPWDIYFANTGGPYPTAAIFETDAETGSIILVASCNTGYCTYPGTVIVTGFPVNKGKPGSIFAPSGLAFDPNACGLVDGKKTCAGALYVVDGVNNTVVAIYNALNLRNKDSIIVGKTGKTFTGKDASWAHVLYSGAPLKGPISATLVSTSASAQANLVVGNTLGPNDLIEISPTGKLLDTVNVDKGVAGALFGMQAVGYGAATKLYFNDDNANNVQVLEK